MAMNSWIESARQAVKRSQVVRDGLPDEAHTMLADGEYAAAKRIFEDILEEDFPGVSDSVEVTPGSIQSSN